jgi:class 3 adenylate cyclase
MDCPACLHSNRRDAKFCEECGNPLSRACRACGAAISAATKFSAESGAPTGANAKQIRSAVGSQPPRDYTPKHLAARILESRGALEGERKLVTVLFSDIQGSMHLSEQVGPEDWHLIMDRFFTIMTAGVHRFDGTINQYTGDGVMALFGAPIAHEDHAQRACLAALYLQDELRSYANEVRIKHELPIAVRIGLNTGDVVVGRIGDDLRMDYTAQGHTVGLAARIQQIAEPGRTYLTEHTASLVSD